MIRANYTQTEIKGDAPIILAEFANVVSTVMNGLKDLGFEDYKITEIIKQAFLDGMNDFSDEQKKQNSKTEEKSISDADLRKALHEFVDSLIDGEEE